MGINTADRFYYFDLLLAITEYYLLPRSHRRASGSKNPSEAVHRAP